METVAGHCRNGVARKPGLPEGLTSTPSRPGQVPAVRGSADQVWALGWQGGVAMCLLQSGSKIASSVVLPCAKPRGAGKEASPGETPEPGREHVRGEKPCGAAVLQEPGVEQGGGR